MITLERIEAGKVSGKIRTQGAIEGGYIEAPKVGERFNFASEPLEAGMSVRIITTSPVAKILSDGFITESGSRYQLLTIDDLNIP